MSYKAKLRPDIKDRGKPSVEFVFEGKPRYFCYGYIDQSTEELIDECREWKDEHDSKDEYNVDPSQFDDEDEYVDALRKLWKRKYDYFNEFSSIDPSNYIHEDAYGKAIDNKRIG